DLLHVKVQDVHAHGIGVNTSVSCSFSTKDDIKIDAYEDQVEDPKVEEYQVDDTEFDEVVVSDESGVDEFVFSEPQVDEIDVDDA
ncbi:hypothetical protein Tco_0055929, partial [Tanacetum coccineum]